MPGLVNSEEVLRSADEPSISIDELRKMVADAPEMTPEDQREQLISFIVGTTSLTREEVIQYLDKNVVWW